MDVQNPDPAAQLRGLFRAVVLEAIVHQAITGSSQTECVHHLWLKAQGPDRDQPGLHFAAGKPGGRKPSPED
eukprot:12883750-Prorocentrum_lima.AAC.1